MYMIFTMQKVPTIINVVEHSTLSRSISISVRYLTIVLMNYLIYHCVSLQYVSEVVIGAPYSVTADLMDHFKVKLLLPFFKKRVCTSSCTKEYM